MEISCTSSWRWVFSRAGFAVDVPGHQRFRKAGDGAVLVRIEDLLVSTGAFKGLGDKDLLWERFDAAGIARKYLPASTLLPWDTEEVTLPDTNDDLFVLKAPLGCQGEGVHFFKGKCQGPVSKLIRRDAERAKAEKGFLESLLKIKGRLPSWVLQRHIKSHLIEGKRKFHLRAYLISLPGSSDLQRVLRYDDYEVRIAGSDYVGGGDFEDRDAHLTNGATGTTKRCLLDDLDEMSFLKSKLDDFLDELILSDEFLSLLDSESRHVGIAAVDIMLGDNGRLYILEFNTQSPGCPPEEEVNHSFQEHLEKFVKHLVGICVRSSLSLKFWKPVLKPLVSTKVLPQGWHWAILKDSSSEFLLLKVNRNTFTTLRVCSFPSDEMDLIVSQDIYDRFGGFCMDLDELRSDSVLDQAEFQIISGECLRLRVNLARAVKRRLANLFVIPEATYYVQILGCKLSLKCKSHGIIERTTKIVLHDRGKNFSKFGRLQKLIIEATLHKNPLAPSSVMIVGPRGCGKSFAAKRTFFLPNEAFEVVYFSCAELLIRSTLDMFERLADNPQGTKRTVIALDQLELFVGEEFDDEDDTVGAVISAVRNLKSIFLISICANDCVELLPKDLKDMFALRFEFDDGQVGENVMTQTKTRRNTSTEPIAGYHNIRRRLEELVRWQFLRAKDLERLGTTQTSGILLHGPPGCGKTLLAQNIANLTKCYFVSASAAELTSEYVGESERLIREFFADATKHAPAVVFLDEIDSIGTSRSMESGSVNNRILATLLTEMDGIDSKGGILIVGACNRVEALDAALLRPGRLGNQIFVGLPSEQDRHEILMSFSKIPWSESVDLKLLASDEYTKSFSCAALKSLGKRAALLAIKDHLNEIKQSNERQVSWLNILNALMDSRNDNLCF